MIYRTLQRMLPQYIRRHVLQFEAAIEDAVAAFGQSIPEGSLVLDAGAGEAHHSKLFKNRRYIGVDLAIGDKDWDYSRLDAIADLTALPFPSSCFTACINIVTLEHVREPECVLREIERTLRPGGRLLLVAPQEWEIHQEPHDYFRYTRYGLQYLLEKTRFTELEIRPLGGYFRLIARRFLNGLQFFHGLWFLPALVVLVPAATTMMLFDRLDRKRAFTLGYICTARKRGV